MPLKHTTETLLAFILGAVIIVTGILMQTIADLPNGLVPWAVLFVLAVLYPLVLAPLFRENRADYEFRLLHWFPALMLLVWLLLQGLLLWMPATAPLFDWYTWGWSLPAVATGFLLLAVFIVKVLRRWAFRLALLAVAFLPFVVGAVANQYYDWSPQIAAVVWQGNWWQLDTTGSGVEVAQNTSSSEKNLSASMDPEEEQYRERLRAMENRQERIARRMEERNKSSDDALAMEDSSASAMNVSSASAKDSARSSVPSISSVSSMPARLPGAGMEWGAIMLFLLAGYCATVQRKTMMRVDS